MSVQSPDPHVAYGFKLPADFEAFPKGLIDKCDQNKLNEILQEIDEDRTLADYWMQDGDPSNIIHPFEELEPDEQIWLIQGVFDREYPALQIAVISSSFDTYDGYAVYIKSSCMNLASEDPMPKTLEQDEDKVSELVGFLNTFFPGFQPAWIDFDQCG